MKNNLSYQEEFYRKIIHMSSSIIPLFLLFNSKNDTLMILIPFSILFIIIDVLRNFITSINDIYKKLFSFVTRKIEFQENNLTGASYVFISAILVIFFFEKNISIPSLLIMSISDSLAAIIGLRYGKTKLFSKSLEGTFSFFVSACIILLIFNISLSNAILISILISIVELFSNHRFNDNISIPIVCALLLSVIV